MTRYADPERCPDCGSAMPFGASRCPSCGLSLQGPLAAELFTTLSTADDLLARLRAQEATTPAAAARPAETAAAAPPPAGGVATLVRPEVTATGGMPPVGPPPRTTRGGLAGASVPKILLGLGALCLLVAALVFLAVAWSAMGVAGRTATLLGLTAIAGGLSAWAARRELRAAAESLGVVALGLLTFDFFGARDAGWFGDISTPGFFVLLGSVLAALGAVAALAVRRTPVSALDGAEVFAVLGVGSAVAGLAASDWLAWSAALTLVVVLTGVVTALAYLGRLWVLTVGAATITASSWLVLVISSFDRAVTNPSLGQLWTDLEVWPLLAAAVLVGALGFVRSLPLTARLTAFGLANLVLAAAVLAPVVDETATVQGAAGAALVLVVSVVAWVVPRPWRRSVAGPLGLGLVWAASTVLVLSAEALVRIADAGRALWDGAAGDSFVARTTESWDLAPWLLPLLVLATAAALVAVARAFPWADRVVAPMLHPGLVAAALAGTVILTAALYAVPIWLVLAALLAMGTSYAATSLSHQRALPLVLAAVFLAPALGLALHATWLTFATLLVLLAASLAVHLRWRALEVSTGAGAVVAASLAGLVWTVGALADASPQWTALVSILVLTGLVLGGPYVDRHIRLSGPPTYARLGLEVGALVSAGAVSVTALDRTAVTSQATWAAVYLTLAGAAASAMALLRADRRDVGWLGGFLLAAASWVRLADLGIEAPEAYTLPTALALLVVGVAHLRRNRLAGTMAALTPGLALALVPSLLWVLAEPIAVRSLLLGTACLALVLAGMRLRWSAPLVHGAVVGALLVLRLATPVAEAVPRWALIGAAGALLVALGITWEKRVRDARRLAGYVRTLR